MLSLPVMSTGDTEWRREVVREREEKKGWERKDERGLVIYSDFCWELFASQAGNLGFNFTILISLWLNTLWVSKQIRYDFKKKITLQHDWPLNHVPLCDDDVIDMVRYSHKCSRFYAVLCGKGKTERASGGWSRGGASLIWSTCAESPFSHSPAAASATLEANKKRLIHLILKTSSPITSHCQT